MGWQFLEERDSPRVAVLMEARKARQTIGPDRRGGPITAGGKCGAAQGLRRGPRAIVESTHH